MNNYNQFKTTVLQPPIESKNRGSADIKQFRQLHGSAPLLVVQAFHKFSLLRAQNRLPARYLVSIPDNGDSRWSRYGLLAL